MANARFAAPAGDEPAAAPDVHALLRAANDYRKSGTHEPLPLGVNKKVAIITCMDSRLMLERMFNLHHGDVEIIRNAGGRVSLDVVRSLMVAQDIPELATRMVIIIHHTDCGGMAAVRRYDHLMMRLHKYLDNTWTPFRLAANAAWTLGWFVPSMLTRPVLQWLMGAFTDPIASVEQDVWLLKNTPTMPRDVPIYGCVYDVVTGELRLVASSQGHGPSLDAKDVAPSY